MFLKVLQRSLHNLKTYTQASHIERAWQSRSQLLSRFQNFNDILKTKLTDRSQKKCCWTFLALLHFSCLICWLQKCSLHETNIRKALLVSFLFALLYFNKPWQSFGHKQSQKSFRKLNNQHKEHSASKAAILSFKHKYSGKLRQLTRSIVQFHANLFNFKQCLFANSAWKSSKRFAFVLSHSFFYHCRKWENLICLI